MPVPKQELHPCREILRGSDPPVCGSAAVSSELDSGTDRGPAGLPHAVFALLSGLGGRGIPGEAKPANQLVPGVPCEVADPDQAEREIDRGSLLLPIQVVQFLHGLRIGQPVGSGPVLGVADRGPFGRWGFLECAAAERFDLLVRETLGQGHACVGVGAIAAPVDLGDGEHQSLAEGRGKRAAAHQGRDLLRLSKDGPEITHGFAG